MNFIHLPSEIRLVLIKDITSGDLRSLVLSSWQLLNAYTCDVGVKKVLARKKDEHAAWLEIIEKVAQYVDDPMSVEGDITDITRDDYVSLLYKRAEEKAQMDLFVRELDPCFIIDTASMESSESLRKQIFGVSGHQKIVSCSAELSTRDLACILYGHTRSCQMTGDDIRRYGRWMKDRQERRRWRLTFDKCASEEELVWRKTVIECLNESGIRGTCNGLLIEALREIIPSSEHCLSDVLNFKTPEDVCFKIMKVIQSDEIKWIRYICRFSEYYRWYDWTRHIAKVKDTRLRTRFMTEIGSRKDIDESHPLVQEMLLEYRVQRWSGLSIDESHPLIREMLLEYRAEQWSGLSIDE